MGSDQSKDRLDDRTKEYIDSVVERTVNAFFAQHFNSEREEMRKSLRQELLEDFPELKTGTPQATSVPDDKPAEPPAAIPLTNETPQGETQLRKIAEWIKRPWRGLRSQGPKAVEQPASDASTKKPAQEDKAEPGRQKGGRNWYLRAGCLFLVAMVALILVFRPLKEDPLRKWQRMLSEPRFAQQVHLWFVHARNEPHLRVSTEAKDAMTAWAKQLENQEVLPTGGRSLATLFEFIHACWWDQAFSIGRVLKGSRPTVDFDLQEISSEDLHKILDPTLSWRAFRQFFPAQFSREDLEVQLAVVRSQLESGSVPCKLSASVVTPTDLPPDGEAKVEADPIAQCQALIKDRADDLKILFTEATTGGSPPVRVRGFAKDAFSTWSNKKPESFTTDDLKKSLTASFEYIDARRFADLGSEGTAPSVDLDVESIPPKRVEDLWTWLAVQGPLPSSWTTADREIQLAVVRAWLKKKNSVG